MAAGDVPLRAPVSAARHPRDFAASALFLGIQFLVAEPTTVMQTGLLLGFYALYRGWYSAASISKT